MGNNLDVKITADVTELQQKFAVARAEAASLSTSMNQLAKQSAAGTLDTAGQSQFAKLAEDYLQAKTSAASYGAQLREATGANKEFTSSLGEVQGMMARAFQVTGIGAAIAAVTEVSSAVKSLAEEATQIQMQSQVLGVTTAQYQAMAVAADEAGVSQEQFARAAEKIRVALDDARNHSGTAIAMLKTLGITNDELTSKTFDVNAALGIFNQRLTDPATKVAMMSALVKELGARQAQAAAAMLHYSGAAADTAAKMALINGYSDAEIGRLHEMGTWWKELGTEAEHAMGRVAIAMGGLNSMDAGYATSRARRLQEAHAQAEQQITDTQRVAAAQQAANATSGGTSNPQIAAAKQLTIEVLEDEQTKIDATATGTAQRLALERQYYEDTLQFYNNDTRVAEVRTAYRAMAEAQKEYTSAQSAAFREELSEFQNTMREEVEARRQTQVQIDQQAKDSEAIVRQDTAAQIQIQRDAVEAKKSLLEAEVGDVASASAAKFASLRTLVNQEYALDQEALQNELKGLEDEPVAYDRVYNEIRELKAKQVAELAALDQQQSAAARRAAQQDATAWRSAVNEIESAESTLVGDLVNKRKSLGQSLVSISANFLQQEIANDAKAFTTRLLIQDKEEAAKKALEQGGLLYHLLTEAGKTNDSAAQETARTAAAQTGAATRTSVTASAAASQQAIAAATGSQTVMADAAKAYAGTFASVAQIPYVGYLIAPGVAAAAFAEVSAMAGLASLDVGAYNVRQDMPANIHAGEAVLSKPEARAWRQQVESGNAGAGGGGDTHNHYHSWSAFDGASVRSLIHSSGFQNEMAASLKKYVGRGGR